MSKQGISLRLEDETIDEIDRLAKVSKRDRTFIINEAIEAYLDIHQWQLRRIDESIAQANDGRFSTDSEVDKVLKKWR
jgi:RHH-type rel operon transcriptional repressor/antitoxin RelB